MRLFVALCALIALSSAADSALVRISFTSKVGLLIDELPAIEVNRVVANLQAKPDSFWNEIAAKQTNLLQYRLAFRPAFYDEEVGTLSLTPPELWTFNWTSTATVQRIDKHNLVVRSYSFENYLVAALSSVMQSDSRFGSEDIIETVVLPVDPVNFVQRTGLACIDEEDFPPGSVDFENVDSFYDDTCEPEDPPSGHTLCEQCHCTAPYADQTCLEALKDHVGGISVDLTFTLVNFDESIASQYRIPAEPIQDPQTGDAAPVVLRPEQGSLEHPRVTYKYFTSMDCELGEGCIGGLGWRRLLRFNADAANVGVEDMIVGSTPNIDISMKQYNIYEFSNCHKHFHFSHYGNFWFGQVQESTTKRGFCLESDHRIHNTESSPLHNDFWSCTYQGLAAGWLDSYDDGLPCQWVDITSLDTSTAPHTDTLYFQLNPDGFMCEGERVTDGNGDFLWEDSGFKTYCCGGDTCCGADAEECCPGETVYKPQCDFWSGYSDVNEATTTQTIPLDGEGQITDECYDARGYLSPLRDCGFRLNRSRNYLTCNPGKKTTLFARVAQGVDISQVVRVCESSIALEAGTACWWNDSLANVVVTPQQPIDFVGPDGKQKGMGGKGKLHVEKQKNMAMGKGKDDTTVRIEFICPAARDNVEIGGKYSVYVAPITEDDDHNPTNVELSLNAQFNTLF